VGIFGVAFLILEQPMSRSRRQPAGSEADYEDCQFDHRRDVLAKIRSQLENLSHNGNSRVNQQNGGPAIEPAALSLRKKAARQGWVARGEVARLVGGMALTRP
jgi:hypothetical protein